MHVHGYMDTTHTYIMQAMLYEATAIVLHCAENAYTVCACFTDMYIII